MLAASAAAEDAGDPKKLAVWLRCAEMQISDTWLLKLCFQPATGGISMVDLGFIPVCLRFFIGVDSKL